MKKPILDKMLTVRVSERELNQLTKFSSNREQPRGVIVRKLIKQAVDGNN